MKFIFNKWLLDDFQQLKKNGPIGYSLVHFDNSHMDAIEEDIQEVINYVKTMSEVHISFPLNRRIYKLRDRVIKEYDRCIILKMPSRFDSLKKIISKHLNNIRGEDRGQEILQELRKWQKEILNDYDPLKKILKKHLNKISGEDRVQKIMLELRKLEKEISNNFDPLRKIFEEHLSNIRGEGRIQKILLELRKLQKEISDDQELNQLCQNPEVQLVMDEINKYEELYKEYRDEGSPDKQNLAYVAKMNAKFTKYIEFLEKLGVKVLRHFSSKSEQLKSIRNFLIHPIITQTRLSLFFVFMAYDWLSKNDQVKVLEDEDYNLLYDTYLSYIDYIKFYQEKILETNNEDEPEIPLPPIKSKKVSAQTLYEIINIQSNHPNYTIKNILHILVNRSRNSSKLESVSKNTVKNWIIRNKIFNPELRDKGTSEILRTITKKDVDKWFEYLRWVDSFFKEVSNK